MTGKTILRSVEFTLGVSALALTIATGVHAQEKTTSAPPPPAAPGAGVTSAEAAQAPPDSAPQTQSAGATSVGEVVVTGSYLRGIPQQDRASPVLTLGQQDVAKTGVLNVGDLVKFIPQNVGSTGGVQDLSKGGSDTHDSRSANLRGLGANATLVLLNGRRVVPLEGYVNLNSLVPDIAIARVDTVLDGASAIYGADAVAGVVNLITNTRFQGMDASAQYTDASGTPAFQLQAMFGGGTEKFHTVESVSYTYQDKIQNYQRKVTDFFNGSSGTGANPGSYTLYARPHTASGGDVVINGNDYSALYDKYKNAAGQLSVVDPGCGAPGTQSRYTPAAGGPGFGTGSCTFSFQDINPLRPESRTLLVHNDSEYDLNDYATIFFESSIYHQDAKRYGIPSYAENHNGPTPPIVPAANPYNPFGTDVAFTGRIAGNLGLAGLTTNLQRDEENQYQTVLGSRGKLFGDWTYTSDIIWSRGELLHNDHDTDMRLLQAAFNGYGGQNCNYRFNGAGTGATPGAGNCYYLSPFEKDATTQNSALSYNIQSNEFSRFIIDYLIGDLVVNGTPFHIFGKPVDVAIGGQVRHEALSRSYSDLYLTNFGGSNGPQNNVSGDRDVKSVFGEANYEVISGLNVDAAVRYETYGAFDTTDPKISANWRILPQLSLRGSWSKAFQAPTIDNTIGAQVGGGITNITDPRDGSTVFRSVITTGNPGLQPQTSTVYNVGFTVLPVSKLSFSADYWHYQYDNQIATQNPQAVINADPYGSQVVRGADGSAQTVYVQTYNAKSGTQTSGLDFTTLYTMNVGPARLSFHDNLSYLLSYDIDTGSLVYSGVGRRNASTTSPLNAAAAPQWRNIGGLDINFGRHSLTTDIRYTSGVTDDYNTPVLSPSSREVKSWTVFDFQYGLRLGPDDTYYLNLGMLNAFNRNPPSALYTGYLSSITDAIGRQVYVKIGAHF